MKLHKCLHQLIDLEHVQAVSDYDEHTMCFTVTLALRDEPLVFCRVRRVDVMPLNEFMAERERLIEAWARNAT